MTNELRGHQMVALTREQVFIIGGQNNHNGIY
jgi:hypothetical protein